jgi:hypothetical protein
MTRRRPCSNPVLVDYDETVILPRPRQVRDPARAARNDLVRRCYRYGLPVPPEERR